MNKTLLPHVLFRGKNASGAACAGAFSFLFEFYKMLLCQKKMLNRQNLRPIRSNLLTLYHVGYIIRITIR